MEAPNPEFNAVGKHQAVQKMFAEIAPTYDRLNHLLSANIDKRWRKLAVNKITELLAKPDAAALDLCCGTGDLTLEISRRAPAVRVIGCDFCHPMLVAGKSKFAAHSAALLTEGDALNLPFADDSFDAVTIAFGLRNLENVERGIREIHRVLKPNGRAVILEFSRPIVPLLRGAFGFYFTRYTYCCIWQCVNVILNPPFRLCITCHNHVINRNYNNSKNQKHLLPFTDYYS